MANTKDNHTAPDPEVAAQIIESIASAGVAEGLSAFVKAVATSGFAVAIAGINPALAAVYIVCVGAFGLAKLIQHGQDKERALDLSAALEKLRADSTDIKTELAGMIVDGEIAARLSRFEQFEIARAVEGRLAPHLKFLIESEIRNLIPYAFDTNERVRQLLDYIRADNCPPLRIPYLKKSEASRFRFEAKRVEMIGRETEMAELQAFLESDKAQFLWWLWTGEAGMGKSRLALELCLQNERDWDVGFFDWKSSKFNNWNRWQPDSPTLIVFDYVASQVTDIRDAIESLQSVSLNHPVRFLLLERPIPKLSDWEHPESQEGSGVPRMSLSIGTTWWGTLCPHSESSTIDSRYKAPRELEGLTDKSACSVLAELSSQDDLDLAAATCRQWEKMIRLVDEKCRPLLIAMGYEAIKEAGGNILGWNVETLVNHIILREKERRWIPHLEKVGVDKDRFINLLLFASMCPGLTTNSPAFDDESLREVLPTRVSYGNGTTYSGLVPDASATAIPALQPDLLAECLVIALLHDCIVRDNLLIDAAWQHHGTPFADFLDRLVINFPDSAAISCLLSVNRIGALAPADVLGRLVLRRAKGYMMRGMFSEARQAHDLTASDRFPGTIRAEALGVRGAMKGLAGDLSEAIIDLTSVINMPDAPPDQRAKALNNRGVAYGQLDPPQTDKEIADYTAVIDMPDAPPDQRAMALNNRGVAYGKLDPPQTDKQIADYTAVIDMPDAPPDPRAKALNNRGVTYGQLDPPQTDKKIADYTAVIDMPDAPPDPRAKALNNRGVAYGQLDPPQTDKEIADYTAVIDMPDAPPDQRAKAHSGLGATLDDRLSRYDVAGLHLAMAVTAAHSDDAARTVVGNLAIFCQRRMKAVDQARQIADAIAELSDIVTATTRMESLTVIAQVCQKLGMIDSAQVIAEVGLKLARKESDDDAIIDFEEILKSLSTDNQRSEDDPSTE